MGDKLIFQIYYGEGEIMYGPNGVDLSGFRHVMKGLSKANERNIVGVCKWLMRFFQLDPQQYELKLKGVLSRASHGYFGELVPIEATSTWRQYEDICCERGMPLVLLVAAYLKDQNEVNSVEAVAGPSEAVEDESEAANVGSREEFGDVPDLQPMGVADEGEHIPSIIEDMDLEDEELEEGLADGDSSDEEGNAPVPAEWRDHEFSKLVVSKADQTPWQYHEKEVS